MANAQNDIDPSPADIFYSESSNLQRRIFKVEYDGKSYESLLTSNQQVLAKWLIKILASEQRFPEHAEEDSGVVNNLIQEGTFLLNEDNGNRIDIGVEVYTNVNGLNLDKVQIPAVLTLSYANCYCIVFQLFRCNAIPPFLQSFFNLPFIDFVGVNLPTKLHAIGIHINDWVNLHLLASEQAGGMVFAEHETMSIGHMALIEFERPYEDLIYRTTMALDWASTQFLVDNQVLYATLDCVFAVKLKEAWSGRS